MEIIIFCILILNVQNLFADLPIIKHDTITDDWRAIPKWSLGTIRMAYVDDSYPSFKTLTDESLYTHYILAFAQLNNTNDGVILTNTDSKNKLKLLKEQNPNKSVILGIGRSSRDSFRKMASSSTNRKAFAQSCKSLIDQLGFDDIDLDWEFPTVDDKGEVQEKYRYDKGNYVSVVKELRNVLGKNKWISFFSFFNAGYIDFPNMLRYANYVNICGYDMCGAPDSISVKHHSPLY